VLPRFDLSTRSSISQQFNKFAHAQMLSRMSLPPGRMNITRVNIGILLDTRESNSKFINIKGIQAVRIDFFILKVANIRCFILIAVEIFHNIIRK
jgi:hypothetical protein